MSKTERQQEGKRAKKMEKIEIECVSERKRTDKETWKESKGKTICCINLPLHSASIESFLHSSFSGEDPGDGNAKPHSILPPETLISY